MPCFNPRAHKGRDVCQPASGSISLMFQSTRPQGARRRRYSARLILCCFNPRAHKGRDEVYPLVAHHVTMFQSTRPQGARPQHCTDSSGSEDSFNPRAHKGRDRNTAQIRPAARIVSIHAPTRGATKGTSIIRRSVGFQSTRPQGARLRPLTLINLPSQVSIHAPTRGATIDTLTDLGMLMFQSTRPQGARRGSAMMQSIDASGFNPRAHKGRDPSRETASPSRRGFNPRAHKGRDPCKW